jgi:hypothetical protein
MGVDLVISTVTGEAQIKLIHAAVQRRVRRFIPAEFEGLPRLRPANDPLDRSRNVARQWLDYYRSYMESTSLICGIFYERFLPGGLKAMGMGTTSGFSNEGDFIVDVRNMTGQAPIYTASGTYTTIIMTAAKDVCRFLVRALEMEVWPAEMTMCGQRITVSALVNLIQEMRGKSKTQYYCIEF